MEAAPTGDGRLDQAVNLVDFGNVTADKMGLGGSDRVDFGGERDARIFFSSTEDDVRSGGHEGTHTAFADSFTAAGDDDCFVGVSHQELSRYVLRTLTGFPVRAAS